LGIGPDEFDNFVPQMRDLGLLTQEAAGDGTPEIHSEILLHLVSLGVFGLASIVAIYMVPLVLFIRAARADADAPPGVRSAGLMGACFVISFLVFGLTIEIFNLKLIATFYSLTVAVLLAAAARAGTGRSLKEGYTGQERLIAGTGRMDRPAMVTSPDRAIDPGASQIETQRQTIGAAGQARPPRRREASI
jgi:O-antigen ligase